MDLEYLRFRDLEKFGFIGIKNNFDIISVLSFLIIRNYVLKLLEVNIFHARWFVLTHKPVIRFLIK